MDRPTHDRQETDISVSLAKIFPEYIKKHIRSAYRPFMGHPKIILVMHGGIGDSVLSSGAIEHILRPYPDHRIIALSLRSSPKILAAHPQISKMIASKDQRTTIILSMMIRRYYIWRGTVAPLGQKVSRNHPFARHLRIDMRDLLTMPYAWQGEKTPPFGLGIPPSKDHVVRQWQRVLDLPEPPAPIIHESSHNKSYARRTIGPKGRFIALSTSTLALFKEWRVERFRQLVDRLTAPTGIFPGAHCVVFGAGECKDRIARLLSAGNGDRGGTSISAHFDMPLDLVYACLKRCRMFIGNDSGLMHIAAAAGIPTLGLFGPTNEQYYAPWGEKSAWVRTQKPYTVPARYIAGKRDIRMELLDVEEVEEAVRKLWHHCTSRSG